MSLVQSYGNTTSKSWNQKPKIICSQAKPVLGIFPEIQSDQIESRFTLTDAITRMATISARLSINPFHLNSNSISNSLFWSNCQ